MQEHASVIVLTYITRSVALYFSALQYIFILYISDSSPCKQTDRKRVREKRGKRRSSTNCSSMMALIYINDYVKYFADTCQRFLYAHRES